MIMKKEKLFTILAVCVLLLAVSCNNFQHEQYTSEQKQEINDFVKNIKDADSLQTLLEQHKKEGNVYEQLAIYEVLGRKENNKSNYNQAILYYNKGLEIAEELNDIEEITKALNNIGFCVRRLGAFDESMNYYYRVLTLCDNYTGKETDAIKKNRHVALNSIGNIHKWLGNTAAADSLFRLTLKGDYELGNLRGLAINYANIGSIFEKSGQIDSAWVYFKLSMKYNIENNDKQGIEIGHINFGNLYRTEGKYDEALAEYHIVFDQLTDNANRWHWLSVCIAITNINILQENYSNVLQNLDKAQTIAEQIHSFTHLSDIAYLRYLYYKNTGNYRLALDNYVNTYHWSDSLRNEENVSHVQNLRVSYEREKNARKIEKQETEIKYQKTQRLFFSIGLGIALLALLMLWYMLKLRTKRNRILSEMNATKDKFFSIISHDLKNPAIAQRDALQLLVSHSGTWDVDTLLQYYNELLKSANGQVELLYNLLNWAQVQTGRMPYIPAQIDIISELRADILLVENMAQQKGITLEIKMPDTAIVTGDRNMIITVVRNLLTNAVKFTNKNGCIILEIKQDETGKYIISVSDTGIGMRKEQTENLFLVDNKHSRIGTAGEQGSGLGLIVCKELVEKHGSTLRVESEEGKGSRFWFSLSK